MSTSNRSSSRDHDRLHERALAFFRLSDDAFQHQRQREEEDIKFVDFDDQWDAGIRSRRAAVKGGNGRPAIPARPCLTINKLRQPIQQVGNQARQSRLAIQFSPKGQGATREVAELYDDLARAIQVDSRAHLARNWAFQRAAKAGRGAYRIVTEYANDGDFNLDIVYKRILDSSSVYFDPTAQEPDWSDADGCLITQDLPAERYRREYGDSDMAGMDDDSLVGEADELKGWVILDQDGKASIRVAEFYYVEYEKERLVQTEDGQTLRGAEVDKQGTYAKDRTVETRKVRWCKLNGKEILEGPQDVDGRYIPVIPVIGDESYVNGEHRWTGIVRPAMDAQRSYNVMRSAQVEAVGLAPKAPYVLYAETIEGFEAYWQQANVTNFAYLPLRMVRDGTGAILPAPQRNVVEPAIQAITLAAHEADADVKATTGIFDPSLGNLSPSDRSGKAILALQKQAEMGTSGYLDNLASMSMVYEGKILRDLIPRVYDTPGRIVAAIGADDKRRSVMVNTPYVEQKDGTPQQVPEGTQGAKFYDLKSGEYAVAVNIGKSYTTRSQEASAAMGELMQAMPQIAPAFADVYVENLDIPGGKQIADRIKKMTGQDDAATKDIPPKIQAELQKGQQMIDLLQKELDAKTKIIETETVKANQDLALEQLRIASAEKIATMKIEAELQKAQASVNAEAAQSDLDARLTMLQAQMEYYAEREARAEQQAHETAMTGAEQEHEQGMQGAQMGHDAEMAAQQAAQPEAGA